MSFIFGILYLLAICLFYYIYKKIGVSLTTTFIFIHFCFVGLPFYLFYLDINGYISFVEILGRTIDSKMALSPGNGNKPIIITLMFYFSFLIGSLIGLTTKTNDKINLKPVYIKIKTYKNLAIFIAFISIFYITIRNWYADDFPLFKLLSGRGTELLRDIAFEYTSNHTLPFVFLPSINAQFFRILLPLGALMLLTYSQHTNNKKYYYYFLLLIIISFIMNFGLLKRMPVIFLLMWILIYYNAYKHLGTRIIKVIVLLIFIFFILSLITSLYAKEFNLMNGIFGLLFRIFAGEAIGEFLALEYFGSQYEYMYFDILITYFEKIIGLDVMTFSEYWKQIIGLPGARGYTSVGFMTETYISVGNVALVYYFLSGYLMLKIDLFFKSTHKIYIPFISGIIMVIGFSSVKGLLSQFFTGGTLFLLVSLIIVKKVTLKSNIGYKTD